MTSMGNNNLKSLNTSTNSKRNNETENGTDNRRRHGRKMHDVNMPSGAKVSIVIPSKWPCNCTRVGEKLKLFTLKPDGKMSAREYKIVAEEMHKTLQYHNFKSYDIKLIQKVENCCLWTRFRRREAEIVEDWSAKRVNERMLFHGSPTADDIVKTGFNLNMARGGYYGKGIYFAPHSAKSNSYAAAFLGYRKMLLCRVALGNMHKMTDRNSALVSPPTGCHSIEGKWCHYPEYIIYNADQAYPEYLVHYDIVN